MRTVLCVPGHDERKVAGCRRYAADLVLFDLEDAVPAPERDRARSLVAAAAGPCDAVRVNGLASGRLEEDVAAMAPTGATIWLPKAASWWELIKFPEGLVVVIIETPALLLRLSEVLDWLPRAVAGLAFGAADLCAATGAALRGELVAHARCQVAMAAAAIGVPAFDAPCTSLREELVEREAARAFDLGYRWKGCIHPSQLEVTAAVGEQANGEVLSHYSDQHAAVMIHEGEMWGPPLIAAIRRRRADP